MAQKSTTVEKVRKGAQKTAETVGGTIAKNPQGTLYVVLGLVGAFSAYRLFKWAKSTGDRLSGDGIDNHIPINVVPDASKTTISRSTAKNYASQLLTAMNHRFFTLLPFPHYAEGTDTDILKTIFDRINGEDFKLIYREFGLKDYNGVGSPEKDVSGGIQDTLGLSEPRDLVYWLREELDFFDFSLRKKVRNLVESAGLIF